MVQRLSHRLRQQVRKLHQRKYREDWGLLLLEGGLLIEEALRSRWKLEAAIVVEGREESFTLLLRQIAAEGIPIYTAPASVFQQLCTTQHPQGICAIARWQQRALDPEKPFLLVDQISDPGNFGSLLRTAEWFGVYNVVVRTGSVDPWSPKVLRGSMGAAFRLAVRKAEDIVGEVRKVAPTATILALTLHPEAQPLPDLAPPAHWAVVVGNETRGIAPEIVAAADTQVRIPGKSPAADSLNAAVAVGITFYHLNFSMRNSRMIETTGEMKDGV